MNIARNQTTRNALAERTRNALAERTRWQLHEFIAVRVYREATEGQMADWLYNDIFHAIKPYAAIDEE